MKPRDCRSVNSKSAGRPRLTHHHKGWWNETKWMKWEWRNGGMKFVVGENERNPEKNLPRPRFIHHETHMERPRRELGTPAVGGERLTACATRPPSASDYKLILMSWMYETHGVTLPNGNKKHKNYYVISCIVWLWNLVSHLERGA